MARDHLAERDNWQAKSAARGQGAEDAFSVIMAMHLEGSQFVAEYKPKDLQGIYGSRKSKRGERPHGIHPEYAIRNSETGKSIYVEIKRQKAAGNAHERACKLMMPGILSSTRDVARQDHSVIPFWWVFTNGIAKDPHYRQEIMHWFQGIEGHVLLWQDLQDYGSVRNHFDRHIRPLLL